VSFVPPSLIELFGAGAKTGLLQQEAVQMLWKKGSVKVQ